MFNIFSIICIYLNSTLSSSTLLIAKLPEAYTFFNPILDIMPVITLFFSLSLCLASCCMFSIKIKYIFN